MKEHHVERAKIKRSRTHPILLTCLGIDAMSLCLLAISFCLIQIALSAPHLPPIVPRDTPITKSISGINATILDHGGHDISSSFQIMLYAPPATTSNNSLSNRRAILPRPINFCRAGTFVMSFCTPQDNKAGSLQSYTVVCGTYEIGMPENSSSEYDIDDAPSIHWSHRFRSGHCAADEICVDGFGEQEFAEPHQGLGSRTAMASCVRTEYFIKYINWGKHEQENLALEGTSANIVASQLDLQTPMEVDTFKIDADISNHTSGTEKKCRDCMKLRTERFGPDTEGLKIETTLLSAGAMAGILWIALLSG